MNWKRLRESVGATFRLRPIPKRVHQGEELDPIDDQWRLESIRNDHDLVLQNLRTGHQKELGRDHIHEFRSPDILSLRSQLTLTEHQVMVEPVPLNMEAVLRIRAALADEKRGRLRQVAAGAAPVGGAEEYKRALFEALVESLSALDVHVLARCYELKGGIRKWIAWDEAMKEFERTMDRHVLQSIVNDLSRSNLVFWNHPGDNNFMLLELADEFLGYLKASGP